MLIYETKDYLAVSSMPNKNFLPNDPNVLFVVDETTEEGKALAAKVQKAAPYYDFVTDQPGNLIDIIEWGSVPYTISINPVSAGQFTEITVPVGAVVTYVDESGHEINIVVDDGILEYLNANPGKHKILLESNNFRPVIFEIEVI